VTLCTAVALVACSKSAAPPADSQIAVKVNNGEISVHQVQAVLQRQPRLPPDATENAASRVLEVLIDQELAAQAARDQGLESDPAIIQQLQASRRELLARTYHDRIAAKAASPTSDEIDRYYDSKPALFAQRRLYVLQESAVEATPAQLPVLQDAVKRAQSVDELTKLLQGAGLRHTTRQLAQAAEDLPLLLLDPISKLEAGQSVSFPQAGGARVFTVLQAHRAPVDRRTAAEAIARFLIVDRRRELVSQAMASLRQGAKLQYEGAFAKAAPGASAPR
jgi:EpsD family peptidyl-prolyl cis-trans isomerase